MGIFYTKPTAITLKYVAGKVWRPNEWEGNRKRYRIVGATLYLGYRDGERD
jgi:hypothetical protein